MTDYYGNQPPACPRCHAEPFVHFLRGQVVRWPCWWWLLWNLPFLAIICSDCKEIVGYEADYDQWARFKAHTGHP